MRDYQKSLEKARELHETSSPEVRLALEKVFTELVGGEDEKIRKDIISFVEQAIDAGYGIISKERKEKWIAWLEKQGKNSMGISEATKQKLEDNLHEALEKETPESCNEFLDEQGEQKSMKTCAEYYNQDNELKMPELSEFQNKLADILMYREYDGPDETEDDIAKGRLEYELAAIRLSEELLPLAQKEQKPADNVEPKFHEGEWIVKNDDSLINIDYSCCKITKVENGNYTIESIYGYKGYNTFETFEKDYHLWTIQDANDGDVLVGGEQLFLFKRMNTSNSFDAHCNYHFIGYDSLSVYDCSYSIDNIYPATKEQRDQLERAMTNAGYRWNKEELKLEK